MQEVQVLEATRTAPNSRGRVRSNPITVERIRVAAYVRVSTDDDDQLGSFESQKLYSADYGILQSTSLFAVLLRIIVIAPMCYKHSAWCVVWI
mgnify:CR=1 FL=1